MLFSLVGVVYDRVHTRDIDKFGGLATEMPLYTAFVGFAFMASLGPARASPASGARR